VYVGTPALGSAAGVHAPPSSLEAEASVAAAASALASPEPLTFPASDPESTTPPASLGAVVGEEDEEQAIARAATVSAKERRARDLMGNFLLIG
jgi:hypothetical protein